MKPTDIAKIRQKLEEILDNLHLAEWGHFDDKSAILVEQALALLPCETCGGDGVEIYRDDNNVWQHRPCPDCQSKPAQEKSPSSTMWEHLH